jgi:hypothetical protein
LQTFTASIAFQDPLFPSYPQPRLSSCLSKTTKVFHPAKPRAFPVKLAKLLQALKALFSQSKALAASLFSQDKCLLMVNPVTVRPLSGKCYIGISTFAYKYRMGELEPWIDENYIRTFWFNLGETVNVKMIRDKFTG